MSSSAATLFFDWVSRCIARNQRVSQLGRLKDRTADGAALVAAGAALEVQPSLAPKQAVLVRAAHRTRKARGPARIDERGFALVFAAISIEKLRHRSPG